jgi:hypothetical protein
MKNLLWMSAWQIYNLCEKIRQNIGVTVTGHKKAKIGVQRCVDRSNFDFLRRGHLGKILVGLWFKIEQRSVCCCIKWLAVSCSLPDSQGHSLKLWHIDKNIPIMSKDKSIELHRRSWGQQQTAKTDNHMEFRATLSKHVVAVQLVRGGAVIDLFCLRYAYLFPIKSKVETVDSRKRPILIVINPQL